MDEKTKRLNDRRLEMARIKAANDPLGRSVRWWWEWLDEYEMSASTDELEAQYD